MRASLLSTLIEGKIRLSDSYTPPEHSMSCEDLGSSVCLLHMVHR